MKNKVISDMDIRTSDKNIIMYVGDSSETDTDIVITEGGQLQDIPTFYNENVSSEENWEIPTVLAPNETSSSSVRWDQLQMDEFPTSPRTRKSQHMPKSHRVIQEKCATRRIQVQLQGKVSSKAVTEDEAREVPGIYSIHLVEEKNSGKFDEDLQKMNQTSNEKSVRKIGANASKGSSNNIKGPAIFSESPPLDHKTTPPIVYIGNILVGLVVIIFLIREMASRH
ncbi:NAC domain-containing protein 62-like isoform X2 [Melia azedarach]|uniref:NAC domain-containing protein 62-like isoform X2 n=1 Tax=Melia azedarach TaxID=155640 RepID=A0ACC1YXS4_MELAZ|nr:NAC domain-containing protein 62-like isoform X2 [Melia azedarach]